jgi:23S rRNA (cytidine1920-2'-O)/16S rRNA (cytidine1409-2'-O)-methyltransferase
MRLPWVWRCLTALRQAVKIHFMSVHGSTGTLGFASGKVVQRPMPEKIRLDQLLVRRGLAESGSQAQALVMAWQVRVDGEFVVKPGTRVQVDAAVAVERGLPYVSRGGQKLEAALTCFDLDVTRAICADVGASTGGFTDCLLQRGAARVYAIDVGYGQLAWSLRKDPRVVNMERTNARTLTTLPETVDLVTIDASFISLKLILPSVVQWLKEKAAVIPLVKPQFEAGKAQVGKGGVVRDAAVHRQVLRSVIDVAATVGLYCLGVVRSPLVGPAGNVEFLLYLNREPASSDVDIDCLLDDIVDSSRD